jgi:hypothetical protein
MNFAHRYWIQKCFTHPGVKKCAFSLLLWKVSSQKSGAELVEPVETNGLRQAQASFPRNIEKIR